MDPCGQGRTIELSGAFCTASATSSNVHCRTTDLDILLHARKVETNSLLVKVAVPLNLDTLVLEDRDMVAPRRVRKEDRLVAGEVSREEAGRYAESTSARDRLRHGDLPTLAPDALPGKAGAHSVLLQWLGVLAVRELRSQLGEVGSTLIVSRS